MTDDATGAPRSSKCAGGHSDPAEEWECQTDEHTAVDAPRDSDERWQGYAEAISDALPPSVTGLELRAATDAVITKADAEQRSVVLRGTDIVRANQKLYTVNERLRDEKWHWESTARNYMQMHDRLLSENTRLRATIAEKEELREGWRKEAVHQRNEVKSLSARVRAVLDDPCAFGWRASLRAALKGDQS